MEYGRCLRYPLCGAGVEHPQSCRVSGNESFRVRMYTYAAMTVNCDTIYASTAAKTFESQLVSTLYVH